MWLDVPSLGIIGPHFFEECLGNIVYLYNPPLRVYALKDWIQQDLVNKNSLTLVLNVINKLERRLENAYS